MRDMITEIKSKFEADIDVTHTSKDFIDQKITVSDPNRSGLDFTFYTNRQGELTLLTTDLFDLARFNIAEGYTSDDIESAILAFLAGEFKLSKRGLMRREYLLIPTSQGLLRARWVGDRSNLPRPYQLKT